MNLEFNCSVRAKGSNFEVETPVGQFTFIIEEPAPKLPVFADFAAWAIAPVAMRYGANIVLDRPISNATSEGIAKTTRIWSNWVPRYFHPVSVIAPVDSVNLSANKTASFFSGGLDSTYSHHFAWQREGKKTDAITVHGMDYLYGDANRFQELLGRIRPFSEKTFNAHRIVKTDVTTLYKNARCNPPIGFMTHAFSLFAAASLFEEYGEFRIASDQRLDHQLMSKGAGTSVAINQQMKNASGRLVTLDYHITRAEKIAALCEVDFDFSTLTFCSRYDSRPRNCGVCEKCQRTKAMFVAVGQAIPNIFSNMEFKEDWHTAISRTKNASLTFIDDIIYHAEKNNISNFPGLRGAKELLGKALEDRTREYVGWRDRPPDPSQEPTGKALEPEKSKIRSIARKISKNLRIN